MPRASQVVIDPEAEAPAFTVRDGHLYGYGVLVEDDLVLALWRMVMAGISLEPWLRAMQVADEYPGYGFRWSRLVRSSDLGSDG
ncbi:MAG TPA: hypothetical protein VGN57_04045 [Pirellulaceae bacterium]|nr:hypothetical protein [Pirellulaceae bacterium]